MQWEYLRAFVNEDVMHALRFEGLLDRSVTSVGWVGRVGGQPPEAKFIPLAAMMEQLGLADWELVTAYPEALRSLRFRGRRLKASGMSWNTRTSRSSTYSSALPSNAFVVCAAITAPPLAAPAATRAR